MLKLSERSKVIGISATARVETVTGNYDIGYLKKQLGDKFCELSMDEKAYLKNLVDKQTENYDDVTIHPIWVQNDDSSKAVLEGFVKLLNGDEELALDIIGKIGNDNGFIQARYLRIAIAFDHFIKEESINAMLCLLNKEPKAYDDKLRSTTLEIIFDNLIYLRNLQDKFQTVDDDGVLTYNINNAYRIINSADFESKKEDFTDQLQKGQKIFLISMYQTIGAGQNLQYIAPNIDCLIDVRSETLESYNNEKTDINAIYLDKPTHLIQLINKKLDEEGFIRYLFQLEFLLEAGRISLQTLNMEVTRAFQNLMASINSNTIPNRTKGSLYNDYNIKQHYSKFVIQAIGRICRTNLKSKDIFILADEKLKKEICDFDVDENIVLREFKELVNSCKSESVIDDVDIYVNKANTSNRRALSHISRFIDREFSWREKDILEWQQLRELCLRFPTMTEEYAKKLIRVLDVYVELPYNGTAYRYSESNDYNNVIIDFKKELPYSVSEDSARLKKILQIPGLREHFETNKYATSFITGKYILSPVMFNNIYKGALGEEVGKFIFKEHLNLDLVDLDREHFELFDYKIKGTDVFVDFKYWQEYSSFDAVFIQNKIKRKLDTVSGKKALIVNILASKDYIPIGTLDGSIVEIGNLFDIENNCFNQAAVTEIMKMI